MGSKKIRGGEESLEQALDKSGNERIKMRELDKSCNNALLWRKCSLHRHPFSGYEQIEKLIKLEKQQL